MAKKIWELAGVSNKYALKKQVKKTYNLQNTD